MAEAAKNWLDHAAAQGLEYSTLMQYRQHVNLVWGNDCQDGSLLR
jgi:hypothetical protein